MPARRGKKPAVRFFPASYESSTFSKKLAEDRLSMTWRFPVKAVQFPGKLFGPILISDRQSSTASVAEAIRPAALILGISAKRGLTRIDHLMFDSGEPASGAQTDPSILRNQSRPILTNIRFSITRGAISPMVPSATRSRYSFRLGYASVLPEPFPAEGAAGGNQEKFEDDAYGSQMLEWEAAIHAIRIDDRHRRRKGRRISVMIQDDRVHTHLPAQEIGS